MSNVIDRIDITVINEPFSNSDPLSSVQSNKKAIHCLIEEGSHYETYKLCLKDKLITFF